MIMEFCRKNRGSISIFLLLVLLPMVTYATMIIDASRLQSAKTEISGAGDLAMSSAMADYEATLHELYGLFAMSPDEEQLKKNVQSYFEKNIRNSLGDEADKDYIKESAKKITDMAFSSDEIDINEYDFDNLINMNPENVEASYVKDSSLANPYILKRQIMEFMKYRGPISCANNILSKFAAFKDSSNQTTVVSNKVDYSTKLNSISDPCLETYRLIEQYFKLSTDFDTIKNSLDSRYAKAQQLYQVATIVMVGDCKLNKDKIEFETIEDIKYNGETEEEILSDIETKLNEIISIDNNGNGALEQQFGSFETDDNNQSTFTPNAELANLDAAKSNWGLRRTEIITNTADLAESTIEYHITDSDITNIQENVDSCNSTKAKYVENKQKIIEFKKYIDTYDKLVQDYYIYYERFCNQTDNNDKKQEIFNKYQKFCSKSSLNPLCCLYYWQNYLGEVKNLYNTEYIVYANRCIEEAYRLINEYAEKISALNSKAQEIESKLGVVLNNLNEIEAAKENWKKSVDSVSDENIKSNFQSDYDAEKEKFDREKINNLKSIFSELKGKHATDEANVRSVTYFDLKFANNGEPIRTYNRYINDGLINKDTVYNASNFKCQSNLSKGFKPTDDDEKQIKSNEFYKQIEEMYKNSQDKQHSLNEDQKGEVNNVNNFAGDGTNLNNSGSEVKREDTNRGNININLEPETSSNEMTSEQAEEFIRNKFKTITGNSSGNINNTQIEEAGEKEDSKKAGKEYSEKGNNAKDSLNNAQSFLSKIGEIADELGSYVYLEEYVTEMFSCDTDLITKDNKDASITTLAGKRMDKNNSEFYGSEIEYILWGNSDPTKNITYNYGLIYMIRFALNAIYAFTSVEIQSYALEIATAIAGWTVVGVPIVQAIVTIVFALAESAFDIYTLKQGESVPIYKSADTWVCSLTGVGKQAAKELIKVAKEKVVEMSDEAFEKLESELNDDVSAGTQELTDYLKNTAKNQINGIYSEVQNNIVKPFIDNLAQYVDVNKDINVNKSIDDAFEKAKASAESYVNGLGEGMQKEIANKLWSLFETNCLDSLKSQVKQKLNSKEPFTISDLINTQMETLKKETTDIVDEYIKKATDKLKEGILDGSGKIIDSAKGQVKSIISENMDSLSESITSKIPSSNGSATGTNSITSKFNSLNYKEYCKIFVFIRIAADEKGVLNNTAKIIQCNVNKKKNVFCMGKAYTMVQISSDIRMNTLFPWAVSVDMDESNNEESINSDIKNAQSDSILIRYNAVNGY